MLADDAAIRPQSLRRAMLAPDRYLAALLAEIPDEDLAAELGAARCCVWKLRFCGWPRVDRWENDLGLMAALVGADVGRLEGLLQRCGVQPPC